MDILTLSKEKACRLQAEEYYHIAVPPSYEVIQDEKYQPFPPPLSPVFAQLPRKRTSSSGGSTLGIGDEKVGGLLLSHMEEEPMTAWQEPQAEMDVDKLLSEKGIFTLWKVLCNTSFKGEGFEVEDLHTLLGEVESWACQLYPQHTFDDLVSQFENIGDRLAIQGCMRGLQQDRMLPGCVDPGEPCELPLSSDSDKREGHSSENDSASKENT